MADIPVVVPEVLKEAGIIWSDTQHGWHRHGCLSILVKHDAVYALKPGWSAHVASLSCGSNYEVIDVETARILSAMVDAVTLRKALEDTGHPRPRNAAASAVSAPADPPACSGCNLCGDCAGAKDASSSAPDPQPETGHAWATATWEWP